MPGCMADTMRLQVRPARDATVQGNKNDICCTRKQGIILLLGIPRRSPARHCFSSARRLTEKSAETKRTGERGKETVFAHRPNCLKPAFVFIRSSPGSLLGGFDGQLSVCQSIMWFLSHNRNLGALLLISFLFRGMKIHISPTAYRHEFATPCTSGGEMKIIKMKYTKRKTIRLNGVKVHLVANKPGPRAAYFSQIKGKDS